MAFETFAGPLKCRPFFYPMLLGQYESEIVTANAYLNHYFGGAQTAQALAVVRGNIDFIAIAKQLSVGGKGYIYFTNDNSTYIRAERKSDGKVYLTYKSPNNNKALTNQVIETSYGSYLCLGFAVDEDTQRAAIFKFSFTYDRATLDHGVGELLGCTVGSDAAALSLQTELYTVLKNASLVPDPYNAGGNSTVENESDGTFDASSDNIAVPATPTLSAQSGGLIALYEIDAANMATFAGYLFGGFDPTNFHKLFESPMEAILCLNYFPYTPPAAATATEISFGSTGTGANGNLLTAQYDEVDCGTVDLDPYYGSCLDFAPYTRVTLVLPYCGTAELDPDEFMGKTIGVVYKVDCYTGACLAIVTANGDVLVQVAGTLANPLPISASNYSSILSSIATVAVAAGTAVATVATGGASTPVAVALTGSLGATAAGSVMSAKPHYNHGGAGGVGSGMFGVQKPYLIIKRPRQCLPENNNNYQGYPSFVTKVLGNCYGFTKVNEIHLEGLSATDGEKKELEAILKGGVWF